MKAGNRFVRTIVFTLLLSVFFPIQGLLFADTPKRFSDLPSNPLYYPAIEVFQKQNIIIGDTMGGVPTGYLRPLDHLQRDEFTKVAVIVRLLEEGNTQLLNLALNPFTLKLNTLLQPYYKVTSSNGAIPFKDILEKDENCAANPSGCNPWHTEFINFASSRGMIKGYTEDSTFRPANPILRIHALKLTIAQDGNLPADQDPKVIRITNDPRLEGRAVRCLVGTEKYILANNGGNTQDAFNLLAYVMQADRLDIFGNRCQAFTEAGAYTPAQRATFLQQPLRRQEIARYFSLTTLIPQLQIDPSADPTVDTKNEYIAPVDTEIKEEEDPLARLKEEGELNEQLLLTDEPYLDETVYLNRPPSDMTIAEQTALSKTGRCCRSKDLYPENNCKVITYLSYSISEESDYNWLTYKGPPWHLATNSWDACWVPYPDILNGYVAPPPTSDYEILKRMMQRRNEIFGNLDAYYLAGHTFEQTKKYGLGDGTKPSTEVTDINDWYRLRPAREQEIYKNLNAYYNTVRDLAKTVEYGYTADKLPIENHWVIKWYEKKKREIEAYLEAQRAAQLAAARATAYKNQQAAAAQKQNLPWYLEPLNPFMPILAPVYNTYMAPTVNKVVNIGIDTIIYNVEQQRFKNEFPSFATADYYGNNKDVPAFQEKNWFDSSYDWVTNPKRVEGLKQVGLGALQSAGGAAQMFIGGSVAVGGSAGSGGLAAVPSIAAGVAIGAFGANNVYAGGTSIRSGFENFFSSDDAPIINDYYNPAHEAIVSVSGGNTALIWVYEFADIASTMGGGLVTKGETIVSTGGKMVNGIKSFLGNNGDEILRGTKNPKIQEAVEYGKKMHKEYDYGDGYIKEVILPSGKRVDAYNPVTNHIIELKPNNPLAIKKGTKQVEDYANEMSQYPQYGGMPKADVITYTPKPSNNSILDMLNPFNWFK